LSTPETRRLVAKLWNYCDVLRDDGVSTIDYVEQLTFLLFLKMGHEQANRQPFPDLALRPVGDAWQSLLDLMARIWRTSTTTFSVSLGMVRTHLVSSSARRRTASRTRPSSRG
jgi:hypothetical protein